MEGAITIRDATEADIAAVVRLAALDEAAVPAAPLLLAFVDGELAAALPADGAPAIADPFRPTLDLVALLRAYAQRDGNGSRTRDRLWSALRGAEGAA